MNINYLRYEWISYHLEREAYRRQMKGRTTPLRHFLPCEKALVFTQAMGQKIVPPSTVVINEAATTICTCHSGMGAVELDRLYSEAIKEFPNIRGGQ